MIPQRLLSGGPAELHPAHLGGGNPLVLAAPDVLPLVFRHKREKLQYKIGDQCTEQIAVLAGIEQRHVEHHNIYLKVMGDPAPLFQNLAVVTA